jgi:hypothetical protein
MKIEPDARVRTLTSPVLSYTNKHVRKRVRENNKVWAIVRRFAMVKEISSFPMFYLLSLEGAIQE